MASVCTTQLTSDQFTKQKHGRVFSTKYKKTVTPSIHMSNLMIMTASYCPLCNFFDIIKF